jgi:iron complex transport system substrate-binding protein
MLRIASLLALTALLACSAALASPAQRVVSLDYCADQFVLRLLPRASILALSPDADKEFSYMREAAKGLPRVRPVAEDILALQPGLVIRSYGGGPRLASFLERAGVPVLQVPFANTLQDIRDMLVAVAGGLGVPEQGLALRDAMDRRLAAIPATTVPRRALYMTPNGVTSGAGTLIHEMLLAANLVNYEQRSGWHPIPLETLAYDQPDLVAAAFFEHKAGHPLMWSATRHPVAQRQLREQETVMLQGAWTSCGGWFLVDAIEALAGS